MRFKNWPLLFLIMLSLPVPLRADEVSPPDEQWHHMGRISHSGYEWLYFDLVNSDGNQLSATFSGPRWMTAGAVAQTRHFHACAAEG